MQRLTLKLVRTAPYEEKEVKFISVDLPKDATEADLRLAFHHVEMMVTAEGQEDMDAAAELVAAIVQEREAIEQTVGTGTVGSPPLPEGTTIRSMDEQRAEAAGAQATYVSPEKTTS